MRKYWSEMLSEIITSSIILLTSVYLQAWFDWIVNNNSCLNFINIFPFWCWLFSKNMLYIHLIEQRKRVQFIIGLPCIDICSFFILIYLPAYVKVNVHKKLKAECIGTLNYTHYWFFSSLPVWLMTIKKNRNMKWHENKYQLKNIKPVPVRKIVILVMILLTVLCYEEKICNRRIFLILCQIDCICTMKSCIKKP